MTISDNSFSATSFPTSSNSSGTSIAPSSNSFSLTAFSKGTLAWTGPNMAGGAFGQEDLFGGPDSSFGIGTFGNINKSK